MGTLNSRGKELFIASEKVIPCDSTHRAPRDEISSDSDSVRGDENIVAPPCRLMHAFHVKGMMLDDV